MGIVQLGHAGGAKSFVARWDEPATYAMGMLLDSESLAIALSLVPGARMSEPLLVAEDIPPDVQGGSSTYQSRLLCTPENATALLATGFSFDDAAASEARQYRIPDATIDGLRREIDRLHGDYYRRLNARMRGARKPDSTPPERPW